MRVQKEKVMTAIRYVGDEAESFETLDDYIERVLARPLEEARPDWYQDCADYSLPKEAMPNWRTVH
jgi:hypothetical protein